MTQPRETRQPSPELFFNTVNAYQRSAALKAAIDLDVFTAIADGHDTPQALAARCAAAKRGLRILCDYLVVIGFLTKTGGRYGLTDDSAVFLNRNSSAFMGTAINFLFSPTLMEGFKDLAGAVRKGGTVIGEEGTVAPEHPVWVEFARSMAPMATLPAQALARLVALDPDRNSKVLDIAAGHGNYGIAFGKQYPHSEVVALDWPGVLKVAIENAKAAGIEARYRTIAGSAFDVDFGSGYDVVLPTNFLHHFDKPTCETLLRKVRSALRDGGRAVTLEFVPNEDRVSPPLAASFSLMMLGTTPSGDAYTFREFEEMFSNAGFARSEHHSLPSTLEDVVISYR